MKTQDTSPLFAGIKIMRLMMILIVTLPRQRVWEHIVTLAKVEGVGNMLRQFLQRFPCYLRPSQNECNFIHIYTPVTLLYLSVHTLTSSPTKVTTIITTHYVDEARGANKVGFLRAGRLLAEDSPQVHDDDDDDDDEDDCEDTGDDKMIKIESQPLEGGQAADRGLTPGR